jgi:AcrR family transcriptional regulator
VTQLRADAQRNLGRVLEAAAEAFAEHGPEVSVDEIARRAGVGHATVFRRFPTKDALIAAVVEHRLQELTELAAAAAEDDAGAGFEEFIWRAAELQARDRGLHQCVGRCLDSEQMATLQRVVGLLIDRAQAAGALRRDVSPDDVRALVGSAIQAAPGDEWRRYVGVVLDGLRPPNTELSTT